MTDFNMPPGVSVNDIPGNRPEDLKEEAFWDTLDGRFMEEVGEETYHRFMNNKSTDAEFDDLLYKYVNIAREMAAIEAVDAYKFDIEMAEIDPNE